jgi:hypothetical protein
MNPLLLGVLCGVVSGIADVLMTVLGGHPAVSRSMLLQAFTSRFAIGILGVNVSLGIDRVLAGALAGLLISLPDAFSLHSYGGFSGRSSSSAQSQDGQETNGRITVTEHSHREKLSYNRIAGQSVERLAALSDGVFAVAMTLLVVDLRAPAAELVHSEQDLWRVLVALAPRLAMYLMSFMTLGIFWVGQQTQLNHLERSSRSLTWIHLTFLLEVTIVLLLDGPTRRAHAIPDRFAGLLGQHSVARVDSLPTGAGYALSAAISSAMTSPFTCRGRLSVAW